MRAGEAAPALGAPPLRVLMTADAVGGVWPYAIDLARSLGDRGIVVDLAVLGPAPDRLQREEAAAVPSLRLHEGPFKLEWMDDAWTDVARAGEWLLDLECRLRPDVVHLNGFCHAALPWHAPRLTVAHSCVVSWWHAVHGEHPPAACDRYAAEVRRGLHAADAVVAPTRAMAASIVNHYGRPRDLRVVPNGRSAEAFRPADRKEPFVFTAGRVWDEAKNVAAVCAAAPYVSWPVVVAGDDEAPDGRRASLGAVRHVGRLRGRALADMFARASIYAWPARYEPFGYSPLEAAFSGCALVLGDLRSLREVWRDAALFVAPDNRRALASAIQRLIDDRALRRRYAERARERSRAFSAQRMAEAYLDLYNRLAGAPAAALTA